MKNWITHITRWAWGVGAAAGLALSAGGIWGLAHGMGKAPGFLQIVSGGIFIAFFTDKLTTKGESEE